MSPALRPLRFLLNGPRAKPRLALAVALGVFTATVVWTFTRPKIYEATAIVPLYSLFFRAPDPAVTTRAEIRSPSGVVCYFFPDETIGRVGRSQLLAKRVASRLDPASRQAVLASGSLRPDADNDDLAEALIRYRTITFPEKDAPSMSLHCSIRLPDPEAAANIANLFVASILEHIQISRAEDARFALEELQLRADAQRDKITTLEKATASSASTSETDLQESRELLRMLESRIHEVQNLRPPSPVVITFAQPSHPDAYISPNIPLNLSLGLGAGLLLGAISASVAARPRVTPPS